MFRISLLSVIFGFSVLMKGKFRTKNSLISQNRCFQATSPRHIKNFCTLFTTVSGLSGHREHSSVTMRLSPIKYPFSS